jgi:hypothetical protein
MALDDLADGVCHGNLNLIIYYNQHAPMTSRPRPVELASSPVRGRSGTA